MGLFENVNYSVDFNTRKLINCLSRSILNVVDSSGIDKIAEVCLGLFDSDKISANKLELICLLLLKDFPFFKTVLEELINSEKKLNFANIFLKSLMLLDESVTNMECYDFVENLIGTNDYTWKVASALFQAKNTFPEFF